MGIRGILGLVDLIFSTAQDVIPHVGFAFVSCVIVWVMVHTRPSVSCLEASCFSRRVSLPWTIRVLKLWRLPYLLLTVGISAFNNGGQ